MGLLLLHGGCGGDGVDRNGSTYIGSTFIFSCSHQDVLCMKTTDGSDGGGSRCQHTSAESTK